MNNRWPRTRVWLGWVIPAIIFIAIFVYLIFGEPDDFVSRMWIVFGAFALVSIPIGIMYGVQDRFWT
ncbi:MAG TPA: hypothetical protein VG326_15275 [Tepidisphaeraceae bacterium]|jgi:hypothetical protein|nr:hypothetical protein [Tepidisphaeraceae bacterium]